ncbi:MAG TPA: aromatic-ring-hydroxylating dioxygenase subunit beta [Burkholderiales bacterium]|nr:aromatic-ring-hydroxylating dioxygenase subunit beta [Burkholderiales bacterium]
MVLAEATQRAIEQLVYEWARAVDENRLEDLAGLLAEDGEYKVASRYNLDRALPLAVIHTRSRSQLRDRITSLRVANIYEAHCYRHLVSGVQVIGEADGAFEVRSNYAVIRIMEHDGASSIFSTGEYRDSVVFEGAAPRFRRRHVVFDSKAIDTLLVYPL